MTVFGEFLRTLRRKSNDPNYPDRKLSQERLGELIGSELGLKGGYSGAAVSDWERSVSKIQADQRSLLICLLIVLHKTGGIQTPSEASELLESGNYRALNPDEVQKIFPEISHQAKEGQSSDTRDGAGGRRFRTLFVKIFIPSELDAWAASAEPGATPTSSWPHLFSALLNRFFSKWTIFRWMRAVAWLWIWLICFWLLIPSLRWPFDGQESAKIAAAMYIVGSIAVPLLVGAMTNTKNNDFWRKAKLENAPLTRLYTHQGASVGFHLGYFFVFALVLIGFYLRLELPIWLEFLIMAFVLLLSFAGARLIPDNLLRAFGQLRLSDGGAFFIFIFIGPFWGIFFIKFYPLFLEPITGTITILLAVTLITIMMAWRYHRSGTTLIPTHWWIIFYGLILIPYQISVSENTYSIVILIGLIFSLSAFFALKRIHISLPGAIGVFIATGLFLLTFRLNWLMPCVFGSLAILIGWRWGKNHISFPVSFFGIILAVIGNAWAFKNHWLSDLQASLMFACIALVLVLWEYKLWAQNAQSSGKS